MVFVQLACFRVYSFLPVVSAASVAVVAVTSVEDHLTKKIKNF